MVDAAGQAAMLDNLDLALDVLRAGRAVLVLDFDGTIAEIAPTPDEAVISGRASESLRRLSGRLALVCVVSGRAVGELRGKVNLDGVTYAGNHGAEYLEGDRLTVAPGLDGFESKVARLFDRLTSSVETPGVVWQNKGLSLSAHYRLAADPEAARRGLAAAVEAAPGRSDVEVFWGKMVMEVRAPSGPDKGKAVRKLAREHRLDGVIVIGDDTTDVDAFEAVSELREAGELRGLSVVVLHPDTPADVAGGGDYALDGVSEVEVLLEWMDGNVS